MKLKLIAAQRKIGQAFESAVHRMGEMDQTSEVKPATWPEVLKAGTGVTGQIALEFGPVVIRLPERPTRRPELFVVMTGRLSVTDTVRDSDSPLQSVSFGTQIAYFRYYESEGRLEHVFGAHYDVDTATPGHPAFHAQLASNDNLAEHVKDRFRLADATVDKMPPGFLKTVRVPTAQMDFLATITQVCSDHLVYKHSSTGTLDAFAALRTDCHVLEGVDAAILLGREDGCLRAHTGITGLDWRIQPDLPPGQLATLLAAIWSARGRLRTRLDRAVGTSDAREEDRPAAVSPGRSSGVAARCRRLIRGFRRAPS